MYPHERSLVKRLREADRQIESLALMDVYGRVAKLLLDVLREHGITMPSSCELGVCGACTVLIDGKTMNSCIIGCIGKPSRAKRMACDATSPKLSTAKRSVSA